ncbi:hypothetical protein DFH08DRAFT_1004438 [Mycena albidolilacea]|uniref:F-box domain-containing protein n=1 Tax=Mycena albidolilacea TaxID=1033008 RepID=A0AAD7F2Y0_9AGAR|nr:hypothetical protein DFH08DRAFT_1004438 [Mycena albidolilacea]
MSTSQTVNAALRARLTQVDASILEVETSILELQLRLRSLQNNWQSIQDQLDSMVYPVFTLPHEITSNIFLHCLPAETSSTAKKGPNLARAPLLLLQVCRTWRDIALSTPRLWVFLHVNLSNLFRDLEESELEKLLADWFLRAGACALSFSAGSPDFMVQIGVIDAIRATLLRFAPRLQSVSLELNIYHFYRFLDIAPFPLLETLTGNFFFGPGEEGFILGATPRLRRLVYTGPTSPSMFRRAARACEGLSAVTCEKRVHPQHFLDLLLSIPSLENFTGSVPDKAVTRHDGVVTHGRLQSLHLSRHSSVRFLRLLRLPALQNLHLETDISTCCDECPEFLSLLARSSASLRRFSTSNRMMYTTEWFSTYMPHLTDLDLWKPQLQFLHDFVRKLDRTQDAGFLPHLQTLLLRNCVFDVDAPLLQALSSRCTAGEGSSVLTSFRVWPHDLFLLSLDESQTTALRALVERGMSILVADNEV